MNCARWMVAAVLVTTMGCVPPVEAPADIEELGPFLYREWDAEQEEVLAAGVSQLWRFIHDHADFEAPLKDRRWSHEAPTAEDLVDVARPDRDPAAVAGVSVAGLSIWPIDDHLRAQSDPDRADDMSALEPSATSYLREFPDTPDPDCFVQDTCARLPTFNTIVRNQVVAKTLIHLNKDFRRLTFVDDEGVERRAMVARSWQEAPSVPASGDKEADEAGTSVLQSYSIDVWLEDGAQTVRFQLTWTETKLLGDIVGPDLVRATVAGGIQDIYETTDELLGEWYH